MCLTRHKDDKSQANSQNNGSSIKDVHTEGVMSKWTNVDMGRGYLSYSGRPQTVSVY